MAGLPGAQGPPGFKVRRLVILLSTPPTLSALVLTAVTLTAVLTWAPMSQGPREKWSLLSQGSVPRPEPGLKARNPQSSNSTPFQAFEAVNSLLSCLWAPSCGPLWGMAVASCWDPPRHLFRSFLDRQGRHS